MPLDDKENIQEMSDIAAVEGKEEKVEGGREENVEEGREEKVEEGREEKVEEGREELASDGGNDLELKVIRRHHEFAHHQPVHEGRYECSV